MKGHYKRVHFIAKPPDQPYSKSVVTISSYPFMKSGSGKVSLSLWNLSMKTNFLKSKTMVTKISAVNMVPPIHAPNIVTGSSRKNDQHETVSDYKLQGDGNEA